jgi:orotidine-5'-phosphate decarboxylase
MTVATDLPTIFCAIDTPDMDRALALSAAMQKAGCGIKLGLEFFSANGSEGVKEIRAAYEDLPLFLDLKFHDIPNTVAGAVSSVCALAPQFINVHASGGQAMMEAAREAMVKAAARYSASLPQLLAVTILTSLDEQALAHIGYRDGLEARVEQMAKLAKASGLDGVVCSAKEIATVRRACGDGFTLMVPGIRPADAAVQDQKRVMTPREALEAGATYLVIGRPITESDNPAQAAADILASIATLRPAKKAG